LPVRSCPFQQSCLLALDLTLASRYSCTTHGTTEPARASDSGAPWLPFEGFRPDRWNGAIWSAVIGQAQLMWLTTLSWRDWSLATCLTEPPTRGFIMPVATSAYATPRFVWLTNAAPGMPP